jgi:hypothetical protein
LKNGVSEIIAIITPQQSPQTWSFVLKIL